MVSNEHTVLLPSENRDGMTLSGLMSSSAMVMEADSWLEKDRNDCHFLDTCPWNVYRYKIPSHAD